MNTTQLKLREDGFIDYTGLELVDPPIFLPYQFEIVNWKPWIIFIHKNWHYVLYVGAFYICLIFGIQNFMKTRKAFELKRELFLWNLVLGIFSIFGFIRMAPEFFGQFSQPNGFYTSICVWQGGNMPTAFWGLMFIFSKYVELGDTMFIVLRKKPLQFLQWYHHLITLAVSWITSPYVEPITRYYVVMNFGVHSLMYPYFALSALGLKIPRKIANVITTLQLTQMFIGLFVNSASALLYYTGSKCYRHPNSMKFFFLVYGSFAVIFGQLFYKLVVTQKRNRIKTQ